MSAEFISLSVPDLSSAEAESVAAATRVVVDGRTRLEALPQFERDFAAMVGRRRAVAVSSGTAALHLGLIHLGAGPGTVVLTSTMTFAATANAICYTGAEPAFIDGRPEDGNVDVDLMLRAADELMAAGVTVAAAIPVDLFGRCVDYGRLAPGLHERGIPMLADAAESVGATHAGRPAGSFGLASACSFNVNKLMTTLGGGMLVTDDDALADHVHKLANQARERVPWYEHTEVGFNYRMSNLAAALGSAQLDRLPDLLAGRRRVREQYAAAFAADDRIRILGRRAGDQEDNCWLTAIVVEGGDLEPTDLIGALRAQEIEARHLWKPMHLQPAHAGARAWLTGASDDLFGSGVCLPSSSTLSIDDVDRVVHAVGRALDRRVVS